jgi:hypothetical protein
MTRPSSGFRLKACRTQELRLRECSYLGSENSATASFGSRNLGSGLRRRTAIFISDCAVRTEIFGSFMRPPLICLNLARRSTWKLTWALQCSSVGEGTSSLTRCVSIYTCPTTGGCMSPHEKRLARSGATWISLRLNTRFPVQSSRSSFIPKADRLLDAPLLQLLDRVIGRARRERHVRERRILRRRRHHEAAVGHEYVRHGMQLIA